MDRKATWNTRLPKRSKAGLSEGMIAMLLIIVGLVIVVFVFMFATGFLGSAAVSPKAAIQQFDITVSGAGSGPAVVTLIIKNTGNVRIDSITTTWINAPAGTPVPTAASTTVDPGRTVTMVANVPAGTLIVGNQYSLRVTINYVNGATEVLTATATAHP
jgi:hypothetical protein